MTGLAPFLVAILLAHSAAEGMVFPVVASDHGRGRLSLVGDVRLPTFYDAPLLWLATDRPQTVELDVATRCVDSTGTFTFQGAGMIAGGTVVIPPTGPLDRGQTFPRLCRVWATVTIRGRGSLKLLRWNATTTTTGELRVVPRGEVMPDAR